MRGTGSNFGLKDNYTAEVFNSLASTLLVNPNAQVKPTDGATIENVHIFPYGVSLPTNRADRDFVGTAITINKGQSLNTIDVTLRNLLICGFAQAVDAYWAPRLICENVNFDCQKGIRVDTAGDPVRFFNCHGWPFASLGIGPASGQDAGQRDRRVGAAFHFLNNADAGKFINCFSFAYATGFRVENANGLTFINCGADNYNLFPPLTSVGWAITGNCGTTVLNGCQAVAHAYAIDMQAASTGNILSVTGGLYAVCAEELFHVVRGSVVLTGAALGASKYAIGVFNDSHVSVDTCVVQGVTTAFLNNVNNSTSISIGDGLDFQIGDVPIFAGASPIPSVPSGSTVKLPPGRLVEVTGTTNIFGFTGGWPGRRVALRFRGNLTLSAASNLMLAGNFGVTNNDILELMFIDATTAIEISRSVN
ncbi:hypothetical protein NS365_01090 [Aureimonas ureilytica]|uniref:Pectate lyase superfamily protein domain-containing protein n=1 Tax=Aureimonas ureilytica TaxID=401562 RepID=A0A147DBK8_9HYPH|nr:hypothetical protein NS365_01090 [Aureimonas ureilytica]